MKITDLSSPSFEDLPTLLQAIQNGNSNASKGELEELLQDLLILDFSQKEGVDSMGGAIPHLLKILSDDSYQALHFTAARVVAKMAKESKELAICLVSSFAVDRLVTSQLVHGMEIREQSLWALGSIASHSEALCHQVLAAEDCLKYILKGYEQANLKDAAAFAVYQFSRYAPRKVLSQELIDAITLGVFASAYTANLSVKVIVILATAMTEADVAKLSLSKAIGHVVKVLSQDYHGIEFQREVLQEFLKLTSKSFIVEIILHLRSHQSVFDTLSKILWSSDRQVQALSCTGVACLTKYMCLKSKQGVKEYQKSENDLFSPLVKLMAYGGAAKIPATVACVQMIRYNASSLAKPIVKSGCIAGLCDVLSDCLEKETCGLLASEIMMALQSILDSESCFEEEDVICSVGLAVARAKLA